MSPRGGSFECDPGFFANTHLSFQTQISSATLQMSNRRINATRWTISFQSAKMHVRFIHLLLVCLLPWSCLGQSTEHGGHRWQSIAYTHAPAPWDTNRSVYFSVGSGNRDGKPQLRLDIYCPRTREKSVGEVLPDPKDIVVLIHCANATTVRSNDNDPGRWITAGGLQPIMVLAARLTPSPEYIIFVLR